MLKRKYGLNYLKLSVGKMKTKALYVHLFKCSFINRFGAVIFELVQGTLSPFVKLKFPGISLRIERAFEKLI